MNLAVGSGIGGVVAVLLGRDAVFVLNALSFLVLGAVDRRHASSQSRTPPKPRRSACANWWTSRRSLEGVRYIRRDRRLLATVLLKGGIGIMGANWVILPIMGERVFPGRLAEPRTQRAARCWA